MELRDYLSLIWRRRWLVALALAIGAGAGLGLSSRTVPIYQATTKIFIGPRSSETSDPNLAFEELAFSRDFIVSYAELLKSRSLAEKVVESENLSIAPTELINRISPAIIADTRIIQISFTDTDAERAQRVVNALATIFVEEDVKEFGGRSHAQASVVETALTPSVPISPNHTRNTIVGAVLGLFLGVGVVLLLEQMDTTFRSREDVERDFGTLPVLAAIPAVAGNVKPELFFEKDPRSPVVEAFRILRTNVQSFGVDSPIRRLLIAGPFAEEGKTTVASNLAAVMAAAGVSTVLVEADLRRPNAHNFFGVPFSPGLSDVLTYRLNLADAVRVTKIQDLFFLPAGILPPNPSELLGSARMKDVLQELNDVSDLVVLDTPPSLPVADSMLLAPQADGVILVLRAGQTRRDHAKQAKEAFERSGVRILGIVLNDVDFDTASYYYQHYYARYESTENGRGRSRSRSRKLAARQKTDAAAASHVVVVPSGPEDRLNASAPTSGRFVEGLPVGPAYSAYCINCRTKREFRGEEVSMSGGRSAAVGSCPECGTRIVRMLARTERESGTF